MHFHSVFWSALRRTVCASAGIRDGARRLSVPAIHRVNSQLIIPSYYPFRPYYRGAPEPFNSSLSSSPPSLYQSRYHPHASGREASPGIRTYDLSLAARCASSDAVNPSRQVEASEAEVANPEFGELSSKGPTAEFGTEGRPLGVVRVEGKGEGGDAEGRCLRVDRRGRRAGAETKDEGGVWVSGAREEREEKEAVAVIARVLKEKYGPQIVRGEWEEGPGSNEVKEEEEGEEREEEEEEEGEDEGEEEEEVEEEVEEGAEEVVDQEDSPGTTSGPGHPTPHHLARATTPSSLLSLYRFFSSHLGIFSPSTVASLLAGRPALLRSNPTNDLLPRVRLLQSYGVSRDDIIKFTMVEPAWLRTSLPQIRGLLDFLLAVGVRRARLGHVVAKGRGLIWSEPSSSNLDILVERAGIPVDKLGVIIERYPGILGQGKDAVASKLAHLSYYLEGESAGVSSSSGQLKKRREAQQRGKNLLGQLILVSPQILSRTPQYISERLSLLQSFTPRSTPSIAITVLKRAPSIFNLSSESLLSKRQFFVGLVGEEVAERIVQNYPRLLLLSLATMERKVVLLSDLIGRKNATCAFAKFPALLTSREENVHQSFTQLVREVREALEMGGKEESSGGKLQAIRGEDAEGGQELEAPGAADAGTAEAHAKELVVSLVLKYPSYLSMNWEKNTKHKVEYLKRDMGLSIKEVLVYPVFLGLSLDWRIRPRHVAVLRMGYVVAPHEVVVGKRRGGNGLRGLKDSVGGRRELVAAYGDGERVEEEGRDGSRDIEQECEVGRSGRVEDSGGPERAARMELLYGRLQEARGMVCLQQFLLRTDKEFEERFNVKLKDTLCEN